MASALGTPPLHKIHSIQPLLERGGIHRNVFKKIPGIIHITDDSFCVAKQIVVLSLCDARDCPVAEIHIERGKYFQDSGLRGAPNEIGETLPMRRYHGFRLGEKLDLSTEAHLLEFAVSEAPAGENRKDLLLVRDLSSRSS